jgi:hypothetical protein
MIQVQTNKSIALSVKIAYISVRIIIVFITFSDHTEQVPLAILKPTLGKFYNSSSFSDMTIVCDGVEFPVHRIILSCMYKLIYNWQL